MHLNFITDAVGENVSSMNEAHQRKWEKNTYK